MTEMNEKAKKFWVLALASIASCMVALDALVVTTALSSIRVGLGASLESLEWTVNAYNLSFAVLLLTGTALGDRFGRRRMFSYGIGLFAAGSAACGLATSVGWLIAARALQGAGAALVVPLAMALLGVAFPREERGRALGIFSGVTGVALIAGPVVGGAIAQGLAWQWIFWINLPIAAIVIPLVARRIDESFGPSATIDIPGIAMVTGSALGLAWGLMRGNSAGWSSLEVVATLGAGLMLAAAFVGWELRAREPMIPMRFFRSSRLCIGHRVELLLLCLNVWRVVLPAAVPPDRAGLRIICRRPATVALDRHAVRGGTVRRKTGQPRLANGRLSSSAFIMQALGMAWIGLIVAPSLAYMQLVVPLDPCRRGCVDGDARGSEFCLECGRKQ